LAAARRLVALAEPGTTVAAPVAVGGAVAISTVDVKAHNPRHRYLSGRWAVPEFRKEQRGLLTRAVEVGDVPLTSVPDVQEALRALDISAACVVPALEGTTGEVALARESFELVGSDLQCRYWALT
jgi:hypothetical protein